MKYLLIALLLAGCETCIDHVNTGCQIACAQGGRMNPEYNCYKACINTTMPRCAMETQ